MGSFDDLSKRFPDRDHFLRANTPTIVLAALFALFALSSDPLRQDAYSFDKL